MNDITIDNETTEEELIEATKENQINLEDLPEEEVS